MDTLFSGSIFAALSFSGRKKKRGDPDKLGFSKLMLYRLICQGNFHNFSLLSDI